MPTRNQKQLELSTFDGRLLDGLTFCRKVYDLFDQVRSEPDGISKLRMRTTIREKKLIEELIPIARYVQARYREGYRVKVRWFSGSQQYDALLSSEGWLVEQGALPRNLYIEVTQSVHENDYLVRERLDKEGVSFSAKTTLRNKETKATTSEPYVYTNDEREKAFAGQIIDTLKRKSAKGYPRGTVLLVNCIADGLIDTFEWNDAIERVAAAKAHLAFREVFLFETGSTSRSTTLYGEN